MNHLELEDPELAEEIKKRMFVFEDIIVLDDRAIQRVLRDVDSAELAKALKSVDAEVQEKIFKNMSKRQSQSLKEDMEFIGTNTYKRHRGSTTKSSWYNKEVRRNWRNCCCKIW